MSITKLSKELDIPGIADAVHRLMPGLAGAGADDADLADFIRLADKYEMLMAQAGMKKWFIPNSAFSIENCPKHKAFFDAGKTYFERCFMAANRVGKSISGGYEIACHLTGDYPSWWNGRVFDHPVECWAIGSTARSTRDVVQKELLGPVGSPGTGMIPADKLGRAFALAGVPQGIDIIEIKHKSGGWSRLGFKNYEQDVQAFYGTQKHAIWLDEECPDLIYNECLMRTMTTGGIMLVTFTPLHGLTPFVVRFCEKATFLAGAKPIHVTTADLEVDDTLGDILNTNPKAVIQAGWDDAPWLGEDAKRRMLDDTPPYLREARSKGVPAMGSGNIYPIPFEEISVTPFKIPDHFKFMYALDVGWNKTAALFAAIDPNTDTIYIYDEHYQGEQLPSVHAEAIKSRGKWLHGVIDPASRGRSQIDGAKLRQMYKDLGLNLADAKNEVESGLNLTWNKLSSGKVKIFSHLHNFAKEYILYRRDLQGKVIKENDHLMDCLRYIVNNSNRALSKQQLSNAGTYNGTRRYDI